MQCANELWRCWLYFGDVMAHRYKLTIQQKLRVFYVSHDETLCTIRSDSAFHPFKSCVLGGPMRNCQHPTTSSMRSKATNKCFIINVQYNHWYFLC